MFFFFPSCILIVNLPGSSHAVSFIDSGEWCIMGSLFAQWVNPSDAILITRGWEAIVGIQNKSSVLNL